MARKATGSKNVRANVDFGKGFGDEGEYYVYALTRLPVTEAKFDPDNIFYVGKGKGLRWQAHFSEAMDRVAQAESDPAVELSKKHKEIKALFDKNDGELNLEQHAYIVRGELTEQEAFWIEALMIKLLNRPGSELTNKVAGQHSERALIPATDVRRFFSAEPVDVDRVRTSELGDFVPGGCREDQSIAIVVKGSVKDMSLNEDIEVDEHVRFNARAMDVGERIGTRRGWDPDQPWRDEEARERARHYWPMSKRTAEILQEIAADERLELAMIIKDPRAGQSAVRYVWEVAADGDWLDYGERVGIPLGDQIEDDEWLGKQLIRNEDGKQILEAMSNGIGYAAYE